MESCVRRPCAMRRSRAMPSPASTNPKRAHESTCASSGASGNPDRHLGPERRKAPQLHAGRNGGCPRDRQRAPRRDAEQHGLSRGAADESAVVSSHYRRRELDYAALDSGHSVVPRAFGTGLVAWLVADASPRSHRHAVGPRSSIVIALPGSGVDGARRRHETPPPARL